MWSPITATASEAHSRTARANNKTPTFALRDQVRPFTDAILLGTDFQRGPPALRRNHQSDDLHSPNDRALLRPLEAFLARVPGPSLIHGAATERASIFCP